MAKLKKWFKKYCVRSLLGMLLVLVFSAHSLNYIRIAGLDTLENLIYDTRVRFTATNESDPRVVILDIDEKSLGSQMLGRWPWSRDRLEELISILFNNYKIKVLAFDVVFAEPDNSSGLRVLESLSKSELKSNAEFLSTLKSLTPQLDYDRRFEAALKNRPVVLGYYFNAGKDAVDSGELPFPVLSKDDSAGTWMSLPKWEGYGSNLAGFVSSATLSGHFNPIVDADGIVRRVPMLIEYEGDLYESLSLAAFRLYQAVSKTSGSPLRLPAIEFSPRIEPEGSAKNSASWPTLERLRIGEARIPVDSATNVLVPYRGGPKSYSYISFLDVLEKRVNPSLLKDTIAIVGTTAPGLLDLRATPMSGIYPGVEVHANLVSALLDSEKPGGIKTYYPNSEFFEFLIIIFIGLGLSFLIPIASPAIALIGFLCVEAAVGSVTQVLWTNGYVFPTASILITFLSLYVLNTAYGFLIEAKQKRQFTSLFGQYVPPELVQKMADDPEKYSMEGRKARLTVLFSDVAGFTSISEQLSPTDLAAYINQYLTSMSMIIRESGGTLDKYIGDAIMAFWGAPVDEPEHAEKAVSAALAMQKKVDELNSEFSQRGWPLLRIGIGLSTGEMTVGDMGSQVRKAYTVMGDAVNLGSRLEGLTRMYKNKIIASQPTVDACKNFIFRELDRVRVKGKDEPVTIYEPLGMSSELASRSAELSTWKSALEAYRSMNWQTCQKILADLKEKYPRDGLYEALSDYIDELRQDSLPENWDAVRKFDTK